MRSRRHNNKKHFTCGRGFSRLVEAILWIRHRLGMQMKIMSTQRTILAEKTERYREQNWVNILLSSHLLSFRCSLYAVQIPRSLYSVEIRSFQSYQRAGVRKSHSLPPFELRALSHSQVALSSCWPIRSIMYVEFKFEFEAKNSSKTCKQLECDARPVAPKSHCLTLLQLTTKR